jgi:predicted Zn-dependent peptidase
MPGHLKHIGLIALLLIGATSSWSAEATMTPSLEDHVRELKLDNGLTIVVAERHNSPTFFALSTFRVGSCQELPNRSGLAHFLEHMLFKGSKTIGTKNYKAEVPMMEELNKLALEVRDHMTLLEAWRYDKFEEYSRDLRANLPAEVREAVATDEAAGLEALYKALPTDPTALPADWRTAAWMLKDNKTDFWALYREIIEHRVRIAKIIADQKQYTTESEVLDGIYDFRGASFMNAFTTPDQTTYMVALPSNCLELWMFLESDRFVNPVFREFYSEREVVMEELRNRQNDPESFLWQKFMGTAFDAHPYSRPIIGWLGDIRSTTESDMDEFFWKYYTPNNCQISLVGDLDTDEVFRLARKYFSSWKAGAPSPAVTIIEPTQEGERRLTVERDANPQLMIGYHIPVAPHPDAYALTVMSNILSNGKTSRFYKSIFEEQGLTASSPYAFNGPSDRYPGLLILNGAPKAPHTNEAVERALYAELEKIKTEGVSDFELQRVRNQYLKMELGRLANNRWLAFSLSGAFVDQGDWRTATLELERIQAVTSDDIKRVATKYLTADNRTVGFLVKKETEQAAAPGNAGDAQ